MGSILHNCSKPVAMRVWTSCGKRFPQIRMLAQSSVKKGLAFPLFLADRWHSMCFKDYGTRPKVLDIWR
jgi:hypothetical protein